MPQTGAADVDVSIENRNMAHGYDANEDSSAPEFAAAPQTADVSSSFDAEILGWSKASPEEAGAEQTGFPSPAVPPGPEVSRPAAKHATEPVDGSDPWGCQLSWQGDAPPDRPGPPQREATEPAPAADPPRQQAAASAPRASRRSGREPSMSSQGLSFLVTVAILLATARFLLPSVVEEVRYAWHRGELRAEYETSGEGLQNVGLDALSQAYQMVTQRVGPSVVHIDVQRTMSEGEAEVAEFLQQRMELPEISDQGSGVVVDKDGYILTNEHVVMGGNVIRVGLSDGRRVPASLVGTDPLTDLAVLKIEADGLIPIRWGDSDRAKVGSPVWAVGSPFGLDRTVTFGILSGKHRVVKASTRYQDFMQSDVAVNPGNSGGPLVDVRGELIGINTAIVGDTYRGVSFSIPSKVARGVYERVRENGSVERGWLGVALQEVSDDLHQGPDPRVRGALVTGLADAASPAAKAGIQPGDVILAIDGDPLLDMGQLMRVVGDLTVGQRVQMRIQRDGNVREITVKIGPRPSEVAGR